MDTKIKFDRSVAHKDAVEFLQAFITSAKEQGWTKAKLDDLVIQATSGDSTFLIETLHNYISDE